MEHPLAQFKYCPKCSSPNFRVRNEKAKECPDCGFVYYFNPSAAVACVIRDRKGDVLVVRRAQEPAKDTLDLPGGFVDMFETAEDAVRREVKEETNLDVSAIRYLFTIPNIYPYSGFDVHTVDIFYECIVADFDHALAADDASGIVILQPEEIQAELFGLHSIHKAVEVYCSGYL
jgi:ADP-ribose pyrophosphatase YjhB (NUDIX family)